MLARVQTGETGFNSRNLEITTTMARVPLMLAINPLFPCKNLKQSAPVSAGSIIMASPPCLVPWGISQVQLSPCQFLTESREGVCKHE